MESKTLQEVIQKEKQLRIMKADNESIRAKLVEAMEELDMVKEEVDILSDDNEALNAELQDARNKLINYLSTDDDETDSSIVKIMRTLDSEPHYLARSKRKYSDTDSIGVKKMGELDPQPFYAAAKMDYSGNEAIVNAVTKCSIISQGFLGNPKWAPFKTITNKDGRGVEVIDEDDEDLKDFKCEHGDEAYKAITKALMEMYEYNHLGRCPVKELWNFQENRKATLEEGITFLANQFDLLHKRTKT